MGCRECQAHLFVTHHLPLTWHPGTINCHCRDNNDVMQAPESNAQCFYKPDFHTASVLPLRTTDLYDTCWQGQQGVEQVDGHRHSRPPVAVNKQRSRLKAQHPCPHLLVAGVVLAPWATLLRWRQQ
jgi:hypothetical protein